MKNIKTISFIGAGNVATHLAKSFFNLGFEIGQVYSKKIDNALQLADDVNSIAIDNVMNLNSNADLYIVAIKDDSIESLLNKINDKSILITHTSGSVPIDILPKNGFINYGIFYPLQTFSKSNSINLSEVPFCIEANQHENELVNLAKQLSNSVYMVNSEQRKKLHIAAVFACNFTNYMYHIAEQICKDNKVDFNILKPLIIETAKKIELNSPLSVQTGPAKRNDKEIISNHLESLKYNDDYEKIYKILTDNIIKSTL